MSSSYQIINPRRFCLFKSVETKKYRSQFLQGYGGIMERAGLQQLMRQNKQHKAHAAAGKVFLAPTLGNVITSMIKSSNKPLARQRKCHHWRDARRHGGIADKDGLRITKPGLRGLEGSMTTKAVQAFLTHSPQIKILKSIPLKLSPKSQSLLPKAQVCTWPSTHNTNNYKNRYQ